MIPRVLLVAAALSTALGCPTDGSQSECKIQCSEVFEGFGGTNATLEKCAADQILVPGICSSASYGCASNGSQPFGYVSGASKYGEDDYLWASQRLFVSGSHNETKVANKAICCRTPCDTKFEISTGSNDTLVKCAAGETLASWPKIACAASPCTEAADKATCCRRISTTAAAAGCDWVFNDYNQRDIPKKLSDRLWGPSGRLSILGKVSSEVECIELVQRTCPFPGGVANMKSATSYGASWVGGRQNCQCLEGTNMTFAPGDSRAYGGPPGYLRPLGHRNCLLSSIPIACFDFSSEPSISGGNATSCTSCTGASQTDCTSTHTCAAGFQTYNVANGTCSGCGVTNAASYSSGCVVGACGAGFKPRSDNAACEAVSGMCGGNAAAATDLMEASGGTYQFACGAGFKLKATPEGVAANGADVGAKKTQCCDVIQGTCSQKTDGTSGGAVACGAGFSAKTGAELATCTAACDIAGTPSDKTACCTAAPQSQVEMTVPSTQVKVEELNNAAKKAEAVTAATDALTQAYKDAGARCTDAIGTTIARRKLSSRRLATYTITYVCTGSTTEAMADLANDPSGAFKNFPGCNDVCLKTEATFKVIGDDTLDGSNSAFDGLLAFAGAAIAASLIVV